MLHQHPPQPHQHAFVQSIAHINDSGTFESSFEVKYIIQSTPQRQKYQYRNECDRENLRRFVREFEQLQACKKSAAKSTPKKFKTFQHNQENFVNIGNINSQNLVHTSVCANVNLEQYFLPLTPSLSPSSSRSASPILDTNDMGCKPLDCEDDEEASSQQDDIANSSTESAFDMHPPLLPSFNVTPPPTQATTAAVAAQKQQRNAAYELARFLRGSFHVKRAKITNLRRSLSDNENLQNSDLPPAQLRASTKTHETMTSEKLQKKKVLEDTTNRRGTSRGSTSSICVSI